MTSELREKLAGRRVVASISGGKDSAAMSLWLAEQGIEHDRVFMDTGWEHPSVYEYLRGPLTKALGPIAEIRGPETMEQLVLRKGAFPTGTRRFCTDNLKKRPLIDYIAAIQATGTPVLNTVGIRAEESLARSKQSEWEWADWLECEVWRPIFRWTLEDVVAIHQRNGLAPHRFYTHGLGVKRLGCWPCINATKAEIRFIADNDPDRIAYLRALEVKVAERAREMGHKIVEQTWFRNEEIAVGLPIDEAVEWSRTSRGGRQFEMFAASGRERGCMRWGLCETSAPDDKEAA